MRNDNDIADFLKRMYTRRIVHDVDAFREKILLSENNYDDRVIELMKLSLSGLMKREHSDPVYRVFLEDLTRNFMEFTVIMGKRAPFEYVTVNTPLDSYRSFQEQYLPKLGRPEEDELIETDQKWAVKAGCPATQYHDRRGRFSDRLASEQERDKDDGVPQEATRFFLSSPVLFP